MIKTFIKDKKMVPISVATKVLGVSIDTIRRWDKSGKLHSERLNGKDRYFSLEELEKVKFAKPLSISEAAMQLKISSTTLRRLEKKALINPKRTQSGARTYDRDVIKKFLESEYFVRGRMKKGIPESPGKYKLNKKEEELIGDIPFESQNQHPEKGEFTGKVENSPSEISSESSEKNSLGPNLYPLQRVPEVLATIAVFLLLFTFGLRNVIMSTASSNASASSAVLSKTEGIQSKTVRTTAESPNASTSSAVLSAAQEIKPKTIVTIKIDDAPASAIVNIRQKPTANSEKIGKAQDGDTFEFVSENEDWYEVKLATGSGFISAEFVKAEGVNSK